MSGTIWTNDQYTAAVAFLTNEIAKEDARWLDNPIGPLGLMWNATGIQPACYLIAFADDFAGLTARVSYRSASILRAKLRSILRAKSTRQFDEILTELRLENHVSKVASPVALEPCVPTELLHSGNMPPSPDFAIRLPDVDVFIEVTVFHFGLFDSWDKRVERLKNAIASSVLKKKLRRAVRIDLPPEAALRNINENTQCALLTKLIASEQGEVVINDFGSEGRIRWATFPHIFSESGEITGKDLSPMDELTATLGIQPSDVSASCGPVAPPTIGFWKTLLPDDNLRELLLKSIRNTLNRKRHQFPHDNAPYLLALEIGDHRLVPTSFLALILERIWNNPDYAWVTGICFFTPREDFRISAPEAQLLVTFNPNARQKPASSLVDLFEGRRQFHLHGPGGNG